MNSLDGLKDQLPVYLKRYHNDRITRSSPGKIEMRCPFHEDKHPSFSADNHKGTWLFKCFSCQASGSLLDLHALDHDLKSKTRENIEAAAHAVGYPLPDIPELPLQKRQQWAKERRLKSLKQKHEESRVNDTQRLTDQIQANLEDTLAPYYSEEWKANIWHNSPVMIDHPETAPHDFIMSLFKADDVLWLGKIEDSGQPHHASHFRTCKEWLMCDELPSRIAAGTFKKGSTSRSKDALSSSPYLVLECDDIIGYKPITPEDKERNKAMSAALIGYAEDKLGLNVRAIIETGNKSLHAWIDRPPDPVLAALRQMAEGLRIDTAVLDNSPSAPLRLPHCIHEKTNQSARLIYLNPINL